MMVQYHEVRRGDVWLAGLGEASGSEQGGVRPVVVIQNDTGNRYSPTTIVAAVTGRIKKDLPTHAVLVKGSRLLRLDSTILLEQIQTIDRSRLMKYLGRLEGFEMRQADEALTVSVGLKNSTEVINHGDTE